MKDNNEISIFDKTVLLAFMIPFSFIILFIVLVKIMGSTYLFKDAIMLGIILGLLVSIPYLILRVVALKIINRFLVNCKKCKKKTGLFFALLKGLRCNPCYNKDNERIEKEKTTNEEKHFKKELEKSKEEVRKEKKICGICGKENLSPISSTCKECNVKRSEIGKILLGLGLGWGRSGNYFDEDKNGKMIATYSTFEILKKLKNESINKEIIEEMVDTKRELHKIKERERKAKIREKVEKEYYGKPKTKREIVSKDLKETIFSKYKNECAICGAKQGLHIHHKDNNAKNNRISNLVLLCGVCHKKAHMKVR